MADAGNRKTRRLAARSGRGRPGGRRASLAILAHRTNDLFVELAKLSARLERLEQALWDVRDECAQLVQRKLRRLLEARGSGHGPGARGSRRSRERLAA